MARALYSALSGLRAHKTLLDVVGNNLANLNTPAFKARRAVFSDMYYEKLRAASRSLGDNAGGTNPIEIGSGASIAQVSKNLNQGSLDPTGNPFDFAIEGDGFFVVHDGTQQLFTRAGAFALDPSGTLVDPATGFRVQRIGTVGEADGVNPGFQTPGDSSIRIPIGAAVPGAATSRVDLRGNLDATGSIPAAEQLTTAEAFTASGAPATLATRLNDLDANMAAYLTGDAITITGTDVDGSPISTSLAVDASSTLGDLVSAIDAAYSQASATLDAQGNIVLEASQVGTAFMSLTLADASGNVGGTNFVDHFFVLTTDGSSGEQYQQTLEVYDGRGVAHPLTVTFQKQDYDLWNLDFSIDSQTGTITNNQTFQVRFNDNGSIQQVVGSREPEIMLTIQFANMTTSQDVTFGLGTTNGFDGLTHVATDTGVNAEQNGGPPGVLTGVNISADGIIDGIASNGRQFPIARLAIASFPNAQGLTSRGDSYYELSPNSGAAQIGEALSAGRGAVRGSKLESSNVDLILEFTRLIIAQRGFSANARSISVTTEVLDELNNLIR